MQRQLEQVGQMPFSRSVRDNALTAAARHCCVCRRYKGVKVEVHHIVPEAKGGPSTEENAIVLCFDCHADAGHYNPRHPRGTRYSPSELRRAKEQWFELVRLGGITGPEEASPVHVRYLICKNFELLTEICRGEVALFPADRPLLARSPILDFQDSALTVHRESYRHPQAFGDSFASLDDYFGKHPDARPTAKGNPVEAYFEGTRAPTPDDVSWVGELDGISRLLAAHDVPAEEILQPYVLHEGCGGDAFQEVFKLRPLWGVFLAITNMSAAPLVMSEIEGLYAEGDFSLYRRFDALPVDSSSIRLPAAPVDSGATVVVPIATVLGPLHPFAEQVHRSEHEQIDMAGVQTVSRVQLVAEPIALTDTWGPVLRPRRVLIRQQNVAEWIDTHDLDLSNVYIIDRHWAIGSCPHVFAVDSDGHVTYVGEALARLPAVRHQDRINLPASTRRVVIAELEEEVTTLVRVVQGTEVLLEDVELHHGMEVSLPVADDAPMIVDGWYQAKFQDSNPLDPIRRSELVGQALRRYRFEYARVGAGGSVA